MTIKAEEEDPRNNAENTRGRPFEKGNPGRPKGSRNRSSRIVEQLLDGQAEGIVNKAVQMALAGDGPMLRAVFGSLAPQQRARDMHIELPPLRTAADALQAIEAARAALAAGEITEGELKTVTAFIEQFLKAVDLIDNTALLNEIAARVGIKTK